MLLVILLTQLPEVVVAVFGHGWGDDQGHQGQTANNQTAADLHVVVVVVEVVVVVGS